MTIPASYWFRNLADIMSLHQYKVELPSFEAAILSQLDYDMITLPYFSCRSGFRGLFCYLTKE